MSTRLRNTTPKIALICCALSAIACGTEQNINDEETEVFSRRQEIGASTVIGAVISIAMSVSDMISKGQVNEALKGLDRRLESVERQVATLETEVANVSYYARRADALNRSIAIGSQRAAVRTALYAHDTKGSSGNGDLWAFHAAKALENPAYYYFAGRTISSPDRFDHRMAISAYLESVSTWIALRTSYGYSWDAPNKAELCKSVAHLNWISGMINSSVACYFIQNEDICEQEAPPVPRCRVTCSQGVLCDDKIDEESYVAWFKTNKGACLGRDDSAAQTRKRIQTYQSDELLAASKAWTALVGSCP